MREYLKEIDAPKTLAALSVVLVSIAVYYNSLSNRFVNWDDPGLVKNNRYIRGLKLENVKAIFSGKAGRAYLPLRDLSYLLDYHFWGLSPRGFHLTSVLLHAAASLLLFLLLRETLGTIRLALFTSLLFAAHPVGTEAVAWVSGRKEVLAAFFLLLGLYLYVKSATVGPEKFWQYYLGALFSFLAASFSKATAVVFPALVILLDFAFRPGAWEVRWRERLLQYGPFFLVGFAAAIVHIIVGAARGTVKTFHGGSLPAHIFLSLRAFIYYLKLIIFPIGLRPFYDVGDFLRAGIYGFSGTLALILTGMFVALAFISLKRWGRVAFALWWFLLTLLPVSGIIPTSTLLAERYLYIPSIGFLFLPALILVRLSTAGSTREEKAQSAIFGIGLLLAILGLFSLGTVRRNTAWRDSVSLWTDALRKSPRSVDVMLKLADAYYARGEKDRPLKILAEAARILPRVAEVHLSKARIYLDQGHLDEAATAAQEALKTPSGSPLTHAWAYLIWGDVLQQKGDAEEAIKKYKLAIKKAPEFIPAYNKLGVAYEDLGEFQQALEVYKRAVAQEPARPDVHYNLGNAYQSLNQPSLAEAAYKKAILLGPEPSAYGRRLQAKVHTNLAALYYDQGRYEQALKQLIPAVDLDNSLLQPRLLLGNIYIHLKDPELAIREFKAALKIDPDNKYAKEALDRLEAAIRKAKSRRSTE